MLHWAHTPSPTVVVWCRDTDVLVKLVAHSATIHKQIYTKVGTSKKPKYIHVNELITFSWIIPNSSHSWRGILWQKRLLRIVKPQPQMKHESYYSRKESNKNYYPRRAMQRGITSWEHISKPWFGSKLLSPINDSGLNRMWLERFW